MPLALKHSSKQALHASKQASNVLLIPFSVQTCRTGAAAVVVVLVLGLALVGGEEGRKGYMYRTLAM